MRLSAGAPTIAASLGIATFALLPAWDAVASLPHHARSAMALAWVVGGTLLLVPLPMVSKWVLSLRSKWRWLPVGLVGLLLAVLLGESSFFLYAHAKEMLAVAAGDRYLVWRNLAATFCLVVLIAAAAWVRRRGWAAAFEAGMAGFGLLAALPFVFMASLLLSSEVSPDANASPALRTTVVLVFDELDTSLVNQRLADLPNFRRLRDTSMSARSIFPPANFTTESLPGMISGEDYDEANYTLGEVFVRPAGQLGWGRMSSRRSMFSDAVDRGERVDVIGWHLPYCNVFKALHGCWDDAAFRAPGTSVSLPAWLLGHSRLVGAYSDWSLKGKEAELSAFSTAFFAAPAMYRLHRIGEIFAQQSAAVLRVLTERQSELVFAHLACPHPPSIKRELLRSMDVFEAYESNLLACDAFLGEVMASLDASPSGHSLTLIVTSDHWFRALNWREAGHAFVVPTVRKAVPFYVRIGDLDGRAESTSEEANTRSLRALVRAAAASDFSYGHARQVIESQGDSVTRMRRY